jgi:hypothetical protein
LPGINPEGLPEISPAVSSKINPEGLPKISPEGLPGISPEGLPEISPEGLPGISPEGLPEISRGRQPPENPIAGLAPEGRQDLHRFDPRELSKSVHLCFVLNGPFRISKLAEGSSSRSCSSSSRGRENA